MRGCLREKILKGEKRENAKGKEKTRELGRSSPGHTPLLLLLVLTLGTWHLAPLNNLEKHPLKPELDWREN